MQPGQNRDNAYRYIQLPNVSAEEMPERVEALLKDLEFTMQDGAAHAVYSDTDKTWQYAFFKPGSIFVGKTTVTSNDVAQIMLRDNGAEWVLSVNNPMPDGQKQTLTFSTSAKLPAGTYTYQPKAYTARRRNRYGNIRRQRQQGYGRIAGQPRCSKIQLSIGLVRSYADNSEHPQKVT